MAFYLALQAEAGTSQRQNSARSNFLIFDIAAPSQGAVIKWSFASCWRSKVVLPASGSAYVCGPGKRSKQTATRSDSLTL